MLAFFLKSIGKGEKLLFGDAFCWENVRHLRLSACDGSGFVKGNNLDLSSLLKRNSSFEKNAVFGTHSVTYHNGNRGGKAKGTGAADHKHGNSSCKSVAEFMSGKQPDNGGDNGNGDNSRHENTGNPVCDFGNRSLGGSCVADHFDDLGECGIFPYAGCLTFDETGLVYSGSRNPVSCCFIYREAFSCKGSLVYCTGAFQDHAVNGNAFAGTYNKHIAFYHLVNGNSGFRTVSDDCGSFGSKLHQTL